MLFVEGGPNNWVISLTLDLLIFSFSCFISRFLTPCFFTTLFNEQFVINKKVIIRQTKVFMNKDFIHIYNSLIKLTTNKNLYIDIKSQDQFSDRITLFLIHFAFFLKNFKSIQNKKILQEIYDFNFRQIELSIREIGYGDQSINKKMKDYINFFHKIITDIHLWDELEKSEKLKRFSELLFNFNKLDKLVVYFDKFNKDLSKKTLNSYIKSVINS